MMFLYSLILIFLYIIVDTSWIKSEACAPMMWHPTNILSSLGVTSFTPMKNFIKASAMCMGGKDNVGKIKIGLYSQEFLPIGWLTDGTEHEI